MCLGCFSWLDKLLYEINLKIGDKEDIVYMEKYKYRLINIL